MGLCTSKANRFERTKPENDKNQRPNNPNIYDLNDHNDLFPEHISDTDDESDLDIGKSVIHISNPLLYDTQTMQNQKTPIPPTSKAITPQPSKQKSLTHTNHDYRTRLVRAYIYDIQHDITIPDDIYNLILKYYQLYQIYGIDHNQTTSTFYRLKPIESILPHSHCLYPSNDQYMIQNGNQIFQVDLSLNNNASKYQIDLHKEQLNNNIELIATGAHETFIKLQNGYIYTSAKVHSSSVENKMHIFDTDLYKMDTIWHNCRSKQRANITQIECGLQHTLLLSDKGRVYSMGNNDRGQCGLGGLMVNLFINKPFLITKFVEKNLNIKSISCAQNSSCCIDRTKQHLWCWGDTKAYLHNDGINPLENAYYSEPNIYLLSTNNADIHVIKAKISHNTTVALDKNGYCYILGEMMYGRPRLNKNIKFKDFDIGYKYVILISIDDEIYRFGQINTHNINSNDYSPYRDIYKLENKLFPNLKQNFIVHSVSIAANSTIIIFS